MMVWFVSKLLQVQSAEEFFGNGKILYTFLSYFSDVGLVVLSFIKVLNKHNSSTLYFVYVGLFQSSDLIWCLTDRFFKFFNK